MVADQIVRREDCVANRTLELHPDGSTACSTVPCQDAAVLPAVKTGGQVATMRRYQGGVSRDLKVHAVRVADMSEEQGNLDGLRP